MNRCSAAATSRGDGPIEAQLAGRHELLAEETALHSRRALVADLRTRVADLRIRPQTDLQPIAAGRSQKPLGLAQGRMLTLGQCFRLGHGQHLVV